MYRHLGDPLTENEKGDVNGSEKGNGKDWIDIAVVAACDPPLCVEHLAGEGEINEILLRILTAPWIKNINLSGWPSRRRDAIISISRHARTMIEGLN